MPNIDAIRSAEVLTEFMEQHRGAFGSDLAGVVLDLRQDGWSTSCVAAPPKSRPS